MYRNLKDIHIGSIIKRIIDDRKVSYSTVGRWLNVDRSSVYNLFAKKSIDIERLIILSRHLECEIEPRQMLTFNCRDIEKLQRVGLASLKIHIEALCSDSDRKHDEDRVENNV